ncbi:hypothetical protein [Litorisediminicola beolgyonensis]|uniref:Uncharacterized protein n=1 Tax=Litorisediminicola beolgyonensis TaxID=1173614 RepID=A0ABW3ZJL0_9RHOB
MSLEEDPRGTPVFLERRSYRRRRLRDGLRLLPVLGLFIWLVPLLWARGGAEAPSSSSVLIYLFTGWAVLIVMARLFAARLARDAAEDSLAEAGGSEG